MVYGDNEKVLDNYLQVFDVINKGRKEMNKTSKQMQIVFVDKPIFWNISISNIDTLTKTGVVDRKAEMMRSCPIS